MAADNELKETIIEQDHQKGPGKFLILAYLVISAFCIYYLFANWDWKSDYEIQQQEIRSEIDQSGE